MAVDARNGSEAGAGVAVLTRGMLFVHSCPPALRPHVEWAVADVLATPVRLEWWEQPISPGSLRAQTGWVAAAGTASRLAAKLRDWPLLRLEITEEPSRANDGERIALTPDLGLFRSAMSANGDVFVQEDRLRAVIDAAADHVSLLAELDRLLGRAWDAELDIYRRAGDGTPMRWLSATG